MREEQLSTAEQLAQFGRTVEVGARIYCELKGIKTSLKRLPVIRVFVDCPYLGPTTPYTDIHYSDTFAFFQSHSPAERDGHEHSPSVVIDLMPAVTKGGLFDASKLKVQLMATTSSQSDDENGGFTIESTRIFSE
jgi:hypothetical protein